MILNLNVSLYTDYIKIIKLFDYQLFKEALSLLTKNEDVKFKNRLCGNG